MDKDIKTDTLVSFILLITQYLSNKGYSKLSEEERQAFKGELLDLLR